jgi:hypothetical protein
LDFKRIQQRGKLYKSMIIPAICAENLIRGQDCCDIQKIKNKQKQPLGRNTKWQKINLI